jgi:hypothetical protein
MLFGFPAGKRDYYILQSGQTSSETHSVSHLMGTYCFFPQGLKDDQSLASITKVKDMWSYMACMGKLVL